MADQGDMNDQHVGSGETFSATPSSAPWLTLSVGRIHSVGGKAKLCRSEKSMFMYANMRKVFNDDLYAVLPRFKRLMSSALPKILIIKVWNTFEKRSLPSF